MERNRFRKTQVIIAALLLLGNYANAQKQDTPIVNKLSVKQAVDYGLKNSVQVKNALLDVLIQKQVNRDVTSAAYPQITANGAFTDYLNIPITLLPGEIVGQPVGTFVPVKFGTKYTMNGGVGLNQLLFDGQVFVGLQARKTTIDAKQKAAEVTEENIKANIYKIYYQLVVGKTQIDLLDANIALIEKLAHDTKLIYDNGFREKLDVDKTTVQLANLQTEKLKAVNMINNGYNGLKFLMGMPMKDSLILTDTLSDADIRDNILDKTQYDYKDRKDFQLVQLSIKMNEYNVRRYKLAQIPTLSLNGNYSKQAQRNKFDFFKGGDWFTTSYIGLQLSAPIFKGFSAKAKIAKAKLELQQSQNQLEALKISIDNDAENAKNNFATAIATMDYQKKNMTLAQKVYDQTKKKYEVGTGDKTSIDAAQTDLKTAQTNYIQSLYDAIIARVDYLKATGKL
jgi:outer membrane protein TolC